MTDEVAMTVLSTVARARPFRLVFVSARRWRGLGSARRARVGVAGRWE